MKIARIAALVAPLIVAAAYSFATPLYSVVDLGTLGGSYSQANAINDSGVVAGHTTTIGGETHIFYYDTAMHDLGGLGLKDGYAFDINSSGQMAGQTKNNGNYLRAYMYSPTGGGVVSNMGFPLLSYNEGLGINDYGSVVGYFTDTTGNWHPYLWRPTVTGGNVGVQHDLGVLSGGRNGIAQDVSSYGTAVGSCVGSDNRQRAMKWAPSIQNGTAFTMTELSGLTPGVSLSSATAINGQTIVGWSTTSTSSSPSHAVIFGSPTRDLGVVSGYSTSAANDVNAAGVVVGSCSMLTSGITTGFVYTGGTMYDLSACLDCRVPGWTIASATGINSAGVICAIARNVTGQTRAVKLVTAPDYPAPSISSISPNNARVGSSTLTMTVAGSNFVPCSRVQWNGNPLTTTYFSQTELRATVPSSLMGSPGAFAVTVSNPSPGGGASNTATFTVWQSNQPPVAVADSAQTEVNTALDIYVLANDYDPEGQAISVSGLTSPTNGGATINTDGSIHYTPHSGFVGADSFTYAISDSLGLTATATVTVTVTEAANRAPVAVDDTVRTGVNTPITIRILRNDYDPDFGDTIWLGYVFPAQYGLATPNADGTVLYEPDPGYEGWDYFQYWISDSQGLMAQATAFIYVSGTADTEAPQFIDTYITPQWAAGGDAVHVEALAIDDVEVAGITANGVELQLGSDSYWYGTLTADSALDYHDVVFEARDASENYSTDTSFYCTLRVVAANTRALRDPIMSMLGSPSLFCKFAVFGRVEVQDGVNFTIDDGSGLPVNVIAFDHTLKSGDFARVRGTLYPGAVPSIFVEDVPRDITLIESGGPH